MIESEDGTVTGSIDVSKLDQISPKSDEAKAQMEQLRRDLELGQEQSAADAERLAEQNRRQAVIVRGDDGVERAPQPDADDRQETQRRQDRADTGQQAQPDDVTQLQAEAEQAGVTVDKRWGADRLRSEIDTAKASAQSRKQRG